MFTSLTQKDEKAIMAENFDSMFAFVQRDGVIEESTPRNTPASSQKSSSGGEETNVSKRVESDDSVGNEYESYSYPPLILQYENNNAKYWAKLDEANNAILDSLKVWIKDDNIEIELLTVNELHPSLLLLRYLRAFKFDLATTKTHLTQSIEKYKSEGIAALALQRPEDILGCSLEDLTAVFPHWHFGYDKEGRPVLFKQYGKFEASHIKKLVGGNFDNVVRYHIWEQEACARLCLAQSKKTKSIIETVDVVIDIEDMTIVQVTGEFMTLIKLLAAVDSLQYPETVGRIFIVNAFTSFHVVWAMVKPWIVPATASKIKVLGGPAEFKPVLIDFIGEENLPSNYGGTLPPLSSKIHPYAESMKSFGDTPTDATGVVADSAAVEKEVPGPAEGSPGKKTNSSAKGWFYN